MVIKAICIDKAKRLWLVIITAVVIAALLITISFIYIYSTNDIKNDVKQMELFNLKNYNAKCEITIVSNKNKNNYTATEWYLDSGTKTSHRFDFNTKENLKMSYILKDNTLSIKSDGQISSLNIQDYNIINTNLISLSTFIQMYNKLLNEKEQNIFRLENKNIDNIKEYTIIVDRSKSNVGTLDKEYSEFLKEGINIYKIKLIVDDKNIPLEYFAYDDREEAVMYIKYIDFNIIDNFDEKIFAN